MRLWGTQRPLRFEQKSEATGNTKTEKKNWQTIFFWNQMKMKCWEIKEEERVKKKLKAFFSFRGLIEKKGGKVKKILIK